MIQIGRSTWSALASGWVFFFAILLAGILSFPGKAEAASSRDHGAAVTVVARAKIQKRIEVRSDNFVAIKNPDGNQLPDISFHDCDFEARKLIKNCILMIYESQ